MYLVFHLIEYLTPSLFITLLLFTDHLDDNEKLWFIHYYCKITSVTLSDNKESLVPPSAPVSLLSVRVFVLLHS